MKTFRQLREAIPPAGAQPAKRPLEISSGVAMTPQQGKYNRQVKYPKPQSVIKTSVLSNPKRTK